MEVYPFFLECSKYESGARRRQLQQLAIGRGGLIIKKKCDQLLILDDIEFKIPTSFSESTRRLLVDKLWPDDTDFFKLQHVIRESKKNWTNSKKKEKLRIIDEYVLGKSYSSPTSMIRTRSIIYMALILKLISSKDISYCNFKIDNIQFPFDIAMFERKDV